MTLLDAIGFIACFLVVMTSVSQEWRRRLERLKEMQTEYNKLRSNAMNQEPIARAETDQKENQISCAVRHATQNLERAEALRDKLHQMLERLRGSTPESARNVEEKLVDTGSMPRLERQHERTTTVIEDALSDVNEIEQYV